MHEITYTQVGGYLIPNLTISDEPQPVYGKYGMLRKQYLKEHRKGTYAQLILSNQLNRHLAEVDVHTRAFVSLLVSEIAQKQGINETMKTNNQMAWVGTMNTIKVQAEEVALAKHVYA
jgi:hypothetical protein